MSGWSKVSWDLSFLGVRASGFISDVNSLAFVSYQDLLSRCNKQVRCDVLQDYLGGLSWVVIKRSQH